MPGERIVFDGLWRCLCPSVDADALSRALRAPLASRNRPSAVHQARAVVKSPSLRARAYRAAVPRSYDLRGPLSSEELEGAEKEPHRRQRQRYASFKEYAEINYHRSLFRLWRRNSHLPLPMLRRGSLDESLDTVPTEKIVDTLREVTNLENQYHTICDMVHYLVTKRLMKPDVFLYTCLINANVDRRYGSASAVAKIFKEMESEGISPTSATFHVALNVLAVHPDYVLRNKVLNDMKAAWIEPTFRGIASIAGGLLRDGQFELALDRLEYFHQHDMQYPRWVNDAFIYILGERGFHEESLTIMQHTMNSRKGSRALSMWYFLLDVYSRDAFYEGVSYIWNRMVVPGIIVPSDGMAINVLNTAARHGDAQMASYIIKTLSARGRKLGLHHFEPLLEIQARGNELRKAFLTLCLMKKAGLQPDLSSTRPIFVQLRQSPEHTDEAVAMLRDLSNDYDIPIAAFNTVLEAILARRGFKAGLDFYRAVRHVCSETPDVSTFGLLFNRCSVPRSMRFLIAEMEVFSVKPNEAIYNQIILISTLSENYEPAFRYLEAMRSCETDGQPNNWWIDKGTALALLRRCILAEDNRAQALFTECKRRGMHNIESDVQTLIREVERKRQQKLSSKAGDSITNVVLLGAETHEKAPELSVA
ncbi:hypothetical protein JX265_000028 [Neoarthrinium moseri]|uniref:Pentatricopeptide repeat-containing protein-mitochondrial domain-containing protein n=1 Tax=Neoarthrinium moseri TaxID=1658444 RepID=A0A9P9WY42_9PEZI|nr:hypothetical protein JX265_000028 [Neoarthrinium moseri]